MASDNAKRRKKPTQAQRIEALEDKLAEQEKIVWALLGTVEVQQTTIEALCSGHDDLVQEGRARREDCGNLGQSLSDVAIDHFEQIQRLRLEALANNSVLSQLLAATFALHGMSSLHAHLQCQNISLSARSLQFPHLPQDLANRLSNVASDAAEDQLKDISSRIALFEAGLKQMGIEASEQPYDTEIPPAKIN